MPPIPELEAIRKAQILEAGLSCLSQKGISKTTLDDVCKAAGLSKGGLVHYYKSKGLLFRAVFEEFFKRIFQRSSDTMATFDTPLDQILSYDWLYDENNLEAYLGYPLLLDLLGLAAHDEECLSMMQDWIESWVTLLSKSLEQGVNEGAFKQMNIRQVAQSISAIYQGIATRWYLGGDHHSSAWAIDSYQKGIMGILSPYLT